MTKTLKHGDQARIAEITGFSHSYVKMIMQGRRKNAKVAEVAQKIIAEREQLKQEFNTVAA